MNKTLSIGATILGVAFICLSLLYWMTPAGSLPTYIPGFELGSTVIHFKHGLAAGFLGVALFAFTWFKSAPAA